MQRQVERKHDRLDNKLQRLQNRGASQARIDKVADRVNQLAQTENNLNALEASPVMYQLNSLDPATNSQGYLSYNANGNNGNGAVVINYIKGVLLILYMNRHMRDNMKHMMLLLQMRILVVITL